MKPIDLFICSYLRQKYTGETLRYLKERTKYPHRVWLLDNGGNEEHRDKVDFYIPFKENIGIHPAWQIAFGLAESEYFITCDSDILVPNSEPDWLTQLVGLMDARPDYGAIALQPHIFIGLNPSAYEDDGEILHTPMTGAVMRLMRRDAVYKANGWERVIRASRNHEEKRVCSQLNGAGYKFGYTSKLKAFHLFGVEGQTDPWGYPAEMIPEQHGHRDIWPRPWVYGRMGEYNNDTWEKL